MKKILAILLAIAGIGAQAANPSFNDVTNQFLLYGQDPQALNYCIQAGITDPWAQQRINNGVMALRNHGLYSHIVDLWIFRTNFNHGSAISFMGKSPTLTGSPVMVEDGMFFNGTSQLAAYPLPRTVTTHTLVVWLQGVTNQPNANPIPWSVTVSGGIAAAGCFPFFGNNTFSSGQFYSRLGGTVQVVPMWYQSATNQGWVAWEARYKSAGYLYNASGQTCSPYVDGLGGVPITGGSVVNITTPLTHLVLGGEASSLTSAFAWWQGTVSTAIMLDTTSLTWQDLQNLENDMAWFEPWSQRYVVVGDSTSTELPNDLPNVNWPKQLQMMGYTNAYRMYNMSANGTRFADWDGFFGGGAHYMTNTYFLGRQGPILESIMDIQLGVNDLYVSGTGPGSDSQNITVCSNTWFQAQNHKYTLRGCTVQSVFTNVSVTWKPTMEQARSNLNNFIMTNFPGRFLYRVDAFLDDYVMNTNNAGTASTDGLHLNAAGYLRMARMRSAQPAMNFSGAVQNAYLDFTNNYAVDGDLAFYLGSLFVRFNGTWISGPNPSFNSISTTNLTLLTNLVANLGSASPAGQVKYASDCITPYGTGGFLFSDGATWRTRSGHVIATTDPISFITNALAIGLTVKTPTMFANINRESWAFNTASVDWYGVGTVQGTAATVGALGTGILGPYSQVYAGTDVQGNAREHMGQEYIQAGDMYGCEKSIYFSKLQDSTDKFTFVIGASDATTTNYPVTGSFLLYDMWNVNGHNQTGVITNHYIHVSCKTGTYSYTDTGITPSISIASPDIICWITTTTNNWFFINGVQVVSTSVNAYPTGGIYNQRAMQIRAAGSGNISVREYSSSLVLINATPRRFF